MERESKPFRSDAVVVVSTNQHEQEPPRPKARHTVHTPLVDTTMMRNQQDGTVATAVHDSPRSSTAHERITPMITSRTAEKGAATSTATTTSSPTTTTTTTTTSRATAATPSLCRDLFHEPTTTGGSPCTRPHSIGDVRDLILHLQSLLGQWSASVRSQTKQKSSSPGTSGLSLRDPDRILSQMCHTLLDLSNLWQLSLHTIIRDKMKLNARKYPVKLCKGKASKYTEYSHCTGITPTHGQSILLETATTSTMDHVVVPYSLANDVTYFREHYLDILKRDLDEFSQEREWLDFHTPTNLTFCLQGELGELSELFQFEKEELLLQDMSHELKDKTSQEIADVAIYLLRLVHVSNIQLFF